MDGSAPPEAPGAAGPLRPGEGAAVGTPLAGARPRRAHEAVAKGPGEKAVSAAAAKAAEVPKRLHGAWEGGWSAGYFNTAGSREGWTPAAFTSSRSVRSERRAYTAADAMDADELAEAEQKQIGAAAGFRGYGAAEDADEHRGDRLLRAAVGAGVAATEAVGERLLRRMGWRQG